MIPGRVGRKKPQHYPQRPPLPPVEHSDSHYLVSLCAVMEAGPAPAAAAPGIVASRLATLTAGSALITSNQFDRQDRPIVTRRRRGLHRTSTAPACNASIAISPPLGRARDEMMMTGKGK